MLTNVVNRTAGGVVFNKKATKIDHEGCQDLLTGERNQHILKTDIKVSCLGPLRKCDSMVKFLEKATVALFALALS